jgi:iron complex transport system permease protein
MPTRHLLSWLLLLALALLAMFGGMLTGSYELSAAEVWRALWDASAEQHLIVTQLRLPRVLLAFLAGGVLALSGFFMQALIKNPLADPYIMGLTAGAGFGVNLVITGLVPLVGYTWLTYPLFAGMGGLASLLLVVTLGWRSFFEDNARLLIAGVATASIFSAATGVLIYRFADSNQVQQLVFWSFGSFARATWEGVAVSAVLLAAGILFGLIIARQLDLLMMGDVQARSLGMNVSRTKFALLFVTSLVTGGTVAFTGPIGFVGMMVPHLCRALFGGQHRANMLLSPLLGGAYLCGCDVLSRWILPPAGLPIGIITAILGVPFFLYLLFSRRSQL